MYVDFKGDFTSLELLIPNNEPPVQFELKQDIKASSSKNVELPPP
jgi:hypothetical protein